jgi:hypothetical protein
MRGNFFSFLLNRLPNERGGDTIHLYSNHNKTVTVDDAIVAICHSLVLT